MRSEPADGARVDAGFGPVSRDLVKRVVDGDEAAALEVVERYKNLVAKLLLNVLGPHDELEDHVHDVLADLLASVHKVRQPQALTVWVHRLATSRAKNILRARRRRRWVLFRPPEAMPERTTRDDPDAREELRRVYRVLDELKPMHRIAFTLRFLHGLELTDIAAACDCSLATIKRRLSRAQKQFIALAGADPVLAPRLARSGRWEGGT